MGLNISYYRNATRAPDDVQAKIAAARVWDAGHYEMAERLGVEIPLINLNFPGRAEGIEDGVAYNAEHLGSFCAGSYTGYGDWRRELAYMVGIEDLAAWWKNPTTCPFAELLDFSDCEGVIGPVVSAKLARDFAEWQWKADIFETDDAEYWRKKYGQWRAAFEAASEGGYVDFH